MWNEYHTFLIVAETLNFTHAAKRLGQNTSSITRAVSRLEEHLGKRLIDRSPLLHLTDAGKRLYAEINPLFEGLLDAERSLRSDDGRVKGKIRVVGPQEVVHWIITPAIARMLEEKHDVQFDVEASTRVPNLIEEPVDIYISHRHKEVTNKSLVSRRICVIPQGLFASPKLIGHKPPPKTLDDLAQWPCLGRLGEPNWELVDEKGQIHNFTVRGPVASTPGLARLEFARRGLGIAPINFPQGKIAMDKGQLVRILPGYTLQNLSLHALRKHPVNPS
ncbi:LysR family transcriptional regulator [Ralstonia insidiosa]|uniref:LysR family transcriptional regulator n=1 Tax=Ralstonia insidiosa TaxID=190721 RepID=A0A848NXL5_9RALS|nr:LysR family transcriptional regulator [Ralstonia insidiosa]NMV38069.1 LysR family transcriptional regulator [Ralstonia insidiosa]